MINKIKELTKQFNIETKNLKQEVLKKKAGTEEILTLKIKYVVKLLQVIFKRK